MHWTRRQQKKRMKQKAVASDNPLIVHIADLEDLEEITEHVPLETELLAKHFWPGPLTMIFEKSALVPYGTTGDWRRLQSECQVIRLREN